MIPQRVKLKGFLCYKDEQAIGFDGNATLWMLSGLNGSGKSAIFDAVTYALFGHHRGGGRDYQELINKDSDTLLVEFDFLLDGKPYRARRTLKRDTKGGARGTQQMLRHEAGKWEPLEGTGQKRDFDAWVKEHVGLEYDTFTSSVLLLQGKAEKLLDSRPEGRREVLAGIVDLGRYERLHQKADERRKALEAELKSLTNRLAAVPAVAPLELAAVRGQIGEAEEARDAARAEVERLHGLEHQARGYQDLRQRLDFARGRLARASGVLADAAAIEQAVHRLRELRDVYPRLKEVVVSRSQGHQAEEQITRLNAERLRQQDDLTARDAALRQARVKQTNIQNQSQRDETLNREVSAQLSAAKVKLAKLAECERHESALERHRAELKALPADPQTRLALAREGCERLEAVARVVPVLARFAGRRQELARAAEHEAAVETSLREVRQRAEARKKEAEGLRPRLEQAVTALGKSTEQATEARTLLAQARQSLDELSLLDGAKVCRHCGQALTEGHLADEKQRRAKEVRAAQQRADRATAALEAARQAEQELRQQVEAADQFVQSSRDEYRDMLSQQRQARASLERAQGECATLYGDLPDEFRRKVAATPPADWLTTAYPQAADLDGLRARANGLEAARRHKAEAEESARKHDQLRAQETAALENLTRLLRDLPTDRAGLRREHTELEAQARALFGAIDAGRVQLREVEKEVERLTRERDQAQQRISHTDARLTEEKLKLQNAQRNVAAQTRELPEAWRSPAERIGIKELDGLRAEKDQLERDGTDEKERELESARHSLSEFQKDVAELEEKEASYAAQAKQELGVIADLLRQARGHDRLCDDRLSEARKQLGLLESYERQRAQLDDAYRATEKELTTHRLLADLLGRERLQLFLVRQAERQVVEYANAVLDRLSGGQLYLRLSGEAAGEGATAKALELEAYNRATGERPINVAFLSGSQKFRVAVSLALGIGQYASRQHRPIESVIIDEGFGCLDSQGRQVMIQELQNLRSQMRCILLVSHQDEFAESFSDGYQFRLENGATRVTRFQK